MALQSIANIYTVARLTYSLPKGLRVLMYHSVGSLVRGDKIGIHSISLERFQDHIDILSYTKIVPLLPIVIPEGQLNIAITFDDGYADNLYVVAPILEKKGIPFTVFVTTEYIRRHEPGFMSPEELKILSKVQGVTIGAHTVSHCDLTRCSDQDLKIELSDSKHYLEDLLGLSVTSMAYPYGLTDRRVRDATSAAAYKVAVCSRFDINQTDRDHFMLNRNIITSEDTPRVFIQKIKGAWDWYRWRYPDPLTKTSVPM